MSGKPSVRITKSALGILGVAAVSLVLGGCVALRPHDDERLTIAKEAAALAQELREPATDPFTAMEANVATVSAVDLQIADLLAQARKETFLETFPDMTRAQILGQLSRALDEHLTILGVIESGVAGAAQGVQQALNRQKLLAAAVGPTPGGGPSGADEITIQKVLDQIKQRQEWLDDLLAKLAKASKIVRLGAAEERVDQVQGVVVNVGQFIETVESDPQVGAARQLLLRVGQEVAVAEKARLEELRSHLATVQQMQKEFAERERVFRARVLLPAFAAVLTAQDVQDLKDLRALNAKKQAEEELSEEEEAKLTQLKEQETKLVALEYLEKKYEALDLSLEEVAEANRALTAHWRDDATGRERPLTEFVAAALADTSPSGDDSDAQSPGETATKLVARLGLILFVEGPLNRKAATGLAAETHLHSIRLSRINSQQRLDLVSQVVEGLKIYYQGGLEPAQVAQLILLASQAVATGFIGTQL